MTNHRQPAPADHPDLASRPDEPASGSRDPEARPCKRETEEKMLDKTVADSFPASDPPSSLPDPCAEDSFAE